MSVKYKRVLIKISGEALAGEDRFGVNAEELSKVALQIKEIRDAGVEVAVVCGGGNFFRGRTGENIDRPTADYMGMLATVMNGLAVQDALLAIDCPAKLMTAIEIRDMAEGYARRKALDYLARTGETGTFDKILIKNDEEYNASAFSFVRNGEVVLAFFADRMFFNKPYGKTIE